MRKIIISGKLLACTSLVLTACSPDEGDKTVKSGNKYRARSAKFGMKLLSWQKKSRD